MSARTCLTIVLGAGEGTRMRSSRPKVLHAMGARPLVAHVMAAVREPAGAAAVVIGPEQDKVAAAFAAAMPAAKIFVQADRRGTAHAVLAARDAIALGADDILVVFADTPLVQPSTLARLREPLAQGQAVAVLGFRPADPAGYGRLIMDGDRLIAIREHKDASAAELAIALCNAGLMALRGDAALAILDRIGGQNAKREFYLTDAGAGAGPMGWRSPARWGSTPPRSKPRRTRCEGSTARASSRRPKPCCSGACATRRSRPASTWWRRRPCIWRRIRNSDATW